jgi:hypothetical protein
MTTSEKRYSWDENEISIVDSLTGNTYYSLKANQLAEVVDILNAQAARIAQLEAALEGLFNRHATLVLSGDCGEWDVMNEPEVEQARAVLARGLPPCGCRWMRTHRVMRI